MSSSRSAALLCAVDEIPLAFLTESWQSFTSDFSWPFVFKTPCLSSILIWLAVPVIANFSGRNMHFTAGYTSGFLCSAIGDTPTVVPYRAKDGPGNQL